ncbi:hypothetical protein NP233_g7280 [Leucocoprinus birnbaumii]|uniref:Uncharacterized protein n=1 Tax=Leucocoprinus birnbaumii TaxID=56174 RepID=A0AAD5YUR5_9AGAR|nr:hypothetical protein NP233_g7280 [Leucocoprinus birnbaumii]
MPETNERRRLNGLAPQVKAEHAGLIRALRTEHTLDLTAHLVKHLRHEDPKPEHGHHSRDQWARWPIPDAPQPDWDLEDEIGVLIKCQFLNKRPDAEHTDMDDEEEDYVDTLARQLTPILMQFVERVLVLAEGHTFPRPPSLQDRINPLNWRDLANILASPAASGLIDGR